MSRATKPDTLPWVATKPDTLLVSGADRGQ